MIELKTKMKVNTFLDMINDRIDVNNYDHIVEAPIDLKSGVLQIINCPTSDIILETQLSKGRYMLRAYSHDIGSADLDEDEGGIITK